MIRAAPANPALAARPCPYHRHASRVRGRRSPKTCTRRDIRRRPAATLVEFALREAPAAGAGAAGPPLLELAQLQTRAMYGIDEPATDDADRAWECADKVGQALRAETPRRERIRQMVGLSSRHRRRKRALGSADRVRRQVGLARLGEKSFDEARPVAGEGAHLGLHLVDDAFDRHEQRELAVAQRVEHLAVVAAGPHGAPVGDEAHRCQVVTPCGEGPERAAHPSGGVPASSSERTTRSTTRSRNE